MAEDQRLITHPLGASRGEIFFSDDTILVSNKPTFLLYGLPKVIKDKKEVATKLAQIIITHTAAQEDDVELKERKIQVLASNLKDKLTQDLYWVSLQKGLDLDIKLEAEKAKIAGIGFEMELNRFYPESSTAAHVLGFVGADSFGKQSGYFGIEGFYNGELKGVEGKETLEKDAKGLPILIGKFFKREAKSGYKLTLNIDQVVQHLVEKKLKEGLTKYGAKGVSAVLMEPKTGAIIAMASFPNYDPGDFGRFPKEYFRNPAVADSYEPGSTFKTLVMAAAVNEGLIKPETTCDNCAGPVEVGGFLIRTWNNKYYPNTTVLDILIHSDNTGMVFVGRKLGVNKLYEYIQKFGFGNLTKVDLQDETTPQVRKLESWKEVDLATASFGQGIAVTAIQMVRALGAIANGGSLMEPHITKYISGQNQTVEIKPRVVATPINPQTAKVITEMMVEAVDKGEARVFKPKGFKIAGKTGTAQIPVEGHYDPNKTIASFVGFAPADDPKFVMLVRYQEPSASIFGAETAAPTFFAIAKELFTYYGITPEE